MQLEKTRPFLKWAGRKFNIIEYILGRLPAGKRLFEPFAGSCAVFLNTTFDNYIISDQNQDLINLFGYVQNEGKKFFDYARTFYVPENNFKERYYELRSYFNQCNKKRERAALFLYLNRHGYNGLCRYNKSGGYNVPFGRYKKPYFPEQELNFFHRKAKSAIFRCCDYKDIMKEAKKGDIIYCDPPYIPLSTSSNFTHYHSRDFTLDDQQELADLARKISKKGVLVLISNHDIEFTRKLYHGAKINSFPVSRHISCKPHERKKVHELLALFEG